MPPQEPTIASETPSAVPPQVQQGPTPEQIEMTKRVMHDSLSARKPKGFLDNVKEWFGLGN